MSGDMPLHPSDEERLAAAMTRELEAMTTTTAIQPSEGFADRVMLAIADEPLPQPVRAFGIALLGGHLRSAAAAVGDAWRTVSSGLAPVVVRAQALALVLVVVLASLTVVGGATVGALGLLGNAPTSPLPSGPPGPPAPSSSPSPTPSPAIGTEDVPSASPEESSGVDASETPEATETAGSHETERPTVRPRTATPTATDDHGGGSGSGSGSGSGGGDHTPSPTDTDNHSGSDG